MEKMEEESLSTLCQLIQAQLTYLARERDRGTGWTASERKTQQYTGLRYRDLEIYR